MKDEIDETYYSNILNKFKILKNQETDMDRFIEFRREEELNKLKLLKKDLIDTMTQLGALNANRWRKHTKITCFTGGIANYAKKFYDAELCTRAWAKCYEILNRYWSVFEKAFPIDENGDLVINTLHLCEGPGAFISALNHFLYSRYEPKQYKWNWNANSLNPYYEHNEVNQLVTDDILIKNSCDKWIYGKHYSGNIRDPENFASIVYDIAELGPIKLISADGGMDCSDEPEIQELKTALICQYEVFAALSVLDINGSLFVKLFTLFETASQNLLLLLCTFFNHVELFKPSTSGHGNSEIYVICSGCLFPIKYRQDLCFKIVNYVRDYPLKLENLFFILPNEIKFSNLVLQRIFEAARFFANYQIECIEENLSIFPRIPDKMLRILKKNQEKFSKHFFENVSIKRLDEDYSLHLSEWSGRAPWYYAAYNFKDCQYGKSLTPDCTYNKHMQWFIKYSFDNQVKKRDFLVPIIFNSPYEVAEFVAKPVFCKKYTQVNYSKFIRTKNINLLNFARSQRWGSIMVDGVYPPENRCCIMCSGARDSTSNQNLQIPSIYADLVQELLALVDSQHLVAKPLVPNKSVMVINCAKYDCTEIMIELCNKSWLGSSFSILKLNELEQNRVNNIKHDIVLCIQNLCFRENSYFENSQRKDLFNIMEFAISHLNVNGDLYLPIGDTFTFFTCNVIIVLISLFETCYLTKTRALKSSPSFTMIHCTGFKMPSLTFSQSLMRVRNAILENRDEDYFIHHFLKIDSKIEDVASKIYEFNQRVTKALAIVTYSDFKIDHYF